MWIVGETDEPFEIATEGKWKEHAAKMEMARNGRNKWMKSLDINTSISIPLVGYFYRC